MSIEQLKIVREWIIWYIMREPKILHDPDVRDIEVYGDPGETVSIDLVDVIASLYELLHHQVTGEPYDYMWHWTNKAGAEVNDKFFDELLQKEKGGKNNGLSDANNSEDQ